MRVVVHICLIHSANKQYYHETRVREEKRKQARKQARCFVSSRSVLLILQNLSHDSYKWVVPFTYFTNVKLDPVTKLLNMTSGRNKCGISQFYHI